jgi:hypothetical protein
MLCSTRRFLLSQATSLGHPLHKEYTQAIDMANWVRQESLYGWSRIAVMF